MSIFLAPKFYSIVVTILDSSPFYVPALHVTSLPCFLSLHAQSSLYMTTKALFWRNTVIMDCVQKSSGLSTPMRTVTLAKHPRLPRKAEIQLELDWFLLDPAPKAISSVGIILPPALLSHSSPINACVIKTLP